MYTHNIQNITCIQRNKYLSMANIVLKFLKVINGNNT